MVKTAIQQLKKGLTSVRSLLLAVKWIFIYGKRAGYRYLFPVLIATVVAGAMMPLQLWALGKIVDAFVIDMRFTQIALYVLPWIIFMIACRFIGDLLEDWGLMRRRYLEEKMTLSIQTDLFQKSTDVAFEYFEDEAYYNQLQRANEGMGAAFLGMVFQIFSILESMVKLVGLSIIVMQGHWLIPFILFIAGIPIFKLQNKFNINRYELVYNQTSELRLMDYFVNLLSSREAAKEVRLYSANTYLVGRWKTLYEKLRVQRLQQSVRQRIIIGAVESLYVLTFGVSLLLLILSLQAGQLSLGVFVTVIYAVISMQEEWEWTIRWVGLTHEDYLDFARDLLTFLALPEQSKKPLSITSKAVKIELINVSYTYPNTTYKVLNNIDLTIEPGEKIALLGENGSGKSTLVKLMSGLLQPTEGEILVNGQKLEHLGSIWEETSVVFQDFAQYHMTVKENIGLGDTRKIEEAATIQDAAEKGGAAEFVNAWPQEMETMLGATFGGHDLSGGQWQKVATSRGFMPDAKLFILDEPTAALDAFSEEKVYERFQKMAGKQTALLISHRIGFARLADQIIVLKAGQLEEQGTHEALEKNNGEYANLLRVQTQWYEED